MISGWKSREEDVPCLSLNLKEIEIVAFRDSLTLLELIKFFLQNGKSLERIKILLKGKKANPEKFYSLHGVQLASEAVSVSISSTSASGEKELIHIVYGKCGVSVQTKTSRSMINKKKHKKLQRRNLVVRLEGDQKEAYAHMCGVQHESIFCLHFIIIKSNVRSH